MDKPSPGFHLPGTRGWEETEWNWVEMKLEWEAYWVGMVAAMVEV